MDAARDSAGRLAAIVTSLGGNRFWSEIVNWWTQDSNGQPPARTTSWLDGEDAARARWLAAGPSPDRAQTRESHG